MRIFLPCHLFAGLSLSMNRINLENLVAIKGNLERVLDNLGEGIMAHDLERRIFAFNREAERITGFSRSEVLGKDCHDIMGGPFCGENCSFCNETADFGIFPKKYPVNLSGKNGEVIRLEMTVTPMTNENGEVVGVLGSFRDITEMLRLKIRAGELFSFSNIIGADSRMIQVYQQIRDVAAFDYPVHIFGETGTGKELVAAAIHNESNRSPAPFVPINCGALPEGLIESELFGHVKGAFSGAIKDKKGRFELADGGTVFLDEVAELSKYMQVKLLRFLQEGTFERVGGEKTIKVDVRIISATNRDLRQETADGTFREDLYYRLNVVPVVLPPLRQRKTDIPLLVEHFLKQASERYGSPLKRISDSAISLMMDYSWPGNVRELQNAVQFSIVKCAGHIVKPEHLPMELKKDMDLKLSKSVQGMKLDLKLVREALARSGGNKSKAARSMGVGRATLYRFIDANPDVMDDSPDSKKNHPH